MRLKLLKSYEDLVFGIFDDYDTWAERISALSVISVAINYYIEAYLIQEMKDEKKDRLHGRAGRGSKRRDEGRHSAARRYEHSARYRAQAAQAFATVRPVYPAEDWQAVPLRHPDEGQPQEPDLGPPDKT